MAGYAVRLLGPPEVRQDGLPLAFKTRKALVLLAYLTLEARLCAREPLAALLWPDSAPAVARSALRNTLSQLRSMVGERLTVSHQSVALTWAETDELDVWRLRQGDPEAWRGELLEGVQIDSETFEGWLAGQREAVRAQADRAFDRQSAALLDGQPQAAAELATRWLGLDRLNEAAWRRLILAHLAAGQTGPAREAFETCQALVRGELGLEAAPETLALEGRLHPTSTFTPEDLPTFLVGGPLVGRQAEFERLVDAYRLAASGRPRVVLLSGEPGIGKTRLAGELLAWAQARGALFLRGRALEGAGAPFAPLVEALRREAAALRTRLDPSSRADLARLLPELQGGPPQESEGDLNARTRAALHAAVTALTPASLSREPLLLLVDDLQWADTSTQEALLYLAAQLAERPQPLLLVLTARAEYLGTGSPLSAGLARLRRQLPLHEERLAPLDAGQTALLLAHSLPRLPEADQARLASWLYAETAGHPLYLTETVKSLLESGALEAGPLDEARLPHGAAGVRAAIGERLARLTPAALALAQGAAVLGRGAAFEILRQVADLDLQTALTGYEELLRTGLLLEHPDQASLSHDRVRETVQGALSAPRRRLLHQRAFRALAPLEAPPAELAGHASEGGLSEAAAAWFERAGREAKEVGAYDEALAFLERALGLTPARPDLQELRLQLLLLITGTLFQRDAGLSPALLARTRRAAEDARAARLPGEFTAASDLLAADLVHAGRLREAEQAARAAHRTARTAGSKRDQVRALLGLARVELARWHWPAATVHAERARRLAESLGPAHEDLALRAGLTLAIIHRWGYGALHQARAQIAALLPRAHKFEQQRAVPPDQDNILQRVLWELTWQDFLVGAYGEALGHLRELEQVGGRTQEMILSMSGLIHLARGDLSSALGLTAAAVETCERLRLRLPNAYGIRALCLLKQGHLDEARQLVAVGQAINRRYNHIRDRADSALRFGEVLAALGDLGGAQREFRWVLGTFSVPHVLGGLRGIGELYARQGDAARAALCLGLVLSHGAVGLYDLQKAEAVLGDLRARFPAEGLNAALAEGASIPLRDVVRRVRGELARPLAQAEIATG